MASPFRRIDPDSRAVIVKDENDNVAKIRDADGNLVDFPIGNDGGTVLMVSDLTSRELLMQILSQLKIMNIHLSLLTNEEIE